MSPAKILPAALGAVHLTVRRHFTDHCRVSRLLFGTKAIKTKSVPETSVLALHKLGAKNRPWFSRRWLMFSRKTEARAKLQQYVKLLGRDLPASPHANPSCPPLHQHPCSYGGYLPVKESVEMCFTVRMTGSWGHLQLLCPQVFGV